MIKLTISNILSGMRMERLVRIMRRKWNIKDQMWNSNMNNGE